jgi:MscS family membrane protein
MLFDVFNRIPLPAPKDIPDEDEMDSKEEMSWTISHTPITIARIADGPRAGEWLFTPGTVDRAAEFYRKTRNLPLKPDAVIDDGYSFYRGQTGWLIPSVLHTVLPDGAHQVYYDQTLWQWFLLVVVVALTGLVAWIGIRWSRHSEPGTPARSVRTLAGPAILILLSYIALYLIDQQVNITGETLALFQHLFDSMFYLAAAWAAVLAGRVFINAILTSPQIDLTRLSADFLRLIVRLLSFVIILIIAAIWLNSLGIPVLGVLAGLGIGGIAIALAAQRTIENFFGAIMLYSDRPVRIGDFCRFGDKMGTVERIGLRSTRIRTPERSVLNVPNAEFSRLQLENLAERDQLRFHTTLNLRLETTPEQLQLVIYRVRGLLLDNDEVDNEPARVRLVAIGPLSLDIEILAYVKTTDFNKFLAIREALFLDILHEVDEAGTALAPPAQVQYNDSAKPVGTKVVGSSDGKNI